MAINLSGLKPPLYVKEISDLYLRTNFQNLFDYFMAQNQFQDFIALEVEFTEAESNRRVQHGLGRIPRDLVRTSIIGSGTVTIEWGKFDKQYIYLSSTGPVILRFYLGTYWKTNPGYTVKASDVEYWSAAGGGGSSTPTAAEVSNTTYFTMTTTNVQDSLEYLYEEAFARTTADQVSTLIQSYVNPYFDPLSGHRHNGTDSRRVLATDLDSTGGSAGKVLAWASGQPVWADPTGGGGLFNLLTLDSSRLPTKPTNSSFETTIGDWGAYANTPGVIPTTMTGGSPGTTVTRTLISPLDGLASMLMDLGSGASRQGEGAAQNPVYVPFGFRGYNFCFEGLYNVVGSFTTGDVIPYMYDITNGAAIAPYYEEARIIGDKGRFKVFFTIPSNCATLRIGFHIARTVTTPLSITFDDLYFSNTGTTTGLAGSNFQQFPMIISSTGTQPVKGTIVRDMAYWRRVGDCMEITYDFEQTTAGTAGSGTFLFSLPTGYQIDLTKVSASTNPGTSSRGSVAYREGSPPNATRFGVPHVYNSTQLALELYLTNAANGFLGSSFGSLVANTALSFTAVVPIVGWDANVSMGEGALIDIASVSATVGRVTGSPPLILGQYRSYLRNANSASFTETGGAPTAPPSIADAFKLYTSTNFTVGDASGQPSKYEIQCGVGRFVTVRCYSAAGRVGYIDVNPYGNGGVSTDFGVVVHYTASTGILTVQEFTSGYISKRLGIDAGGSGVFPAIWFEVISSTNALSVGIQPSVKARYQTSAGQSIPHNTYTVVNFGTADFDNSGMITTGSGWRFTANRPIVLNVGSLVAWPNADYNTAAEFSLWLYKNGVAYANLGIQKDIVAGTNWYPAPTGSTSVSLVPGEYIDVRAFQTNGGAVALINSGVYNYIDIFEEK